MKIHDSDPMAQSLDTMAAALKSTRDRIDYSAAPTPWDAEGLEITRLRLLTDRGFPLLDVSYCWGEIGGRAVNVALPFGQLTKKRWKTELYKYAKATGRYIPGLFDNVSILSA